MLWLPAYYKYMYVVQGPCNGPVYVLRSVRPSVCLSRGSTVAATSSAASMLLSARRAISAACAGAQHRMRAASC